MNDHKYKKSDPEDNSFLGHLSRIATEDVSGLTTAQKSYGNSWKKRGGVGAYMMLARKWDRLEKRLGERPVMDVDCPEGIPEAEFGDRFDIFHHLAADDRGEGLIDDVRDLRRYLMLVEAEARAMGLDCAQAKHRDNPRPEHLTPASLTGTQVEAHDGDEGD